MEYLLVKWLHIVSSTFLFGTGVGSAFYMFFASRTRDTRAIAVVTRYVVIADWSFTTPTVILQPASGFYLVYLAGFSVTTPWILYSLALFALAGACWVPVVRMQIKMRDMAQEAARAGTEIPPLYWRYLRKWTALGIIAFFSLVIVFYLMVSKPG